MRPVALFRHAPLEGPGFLAAFLDRQDIPWQLIAIDAGAAIPATARDFSGLVFMGGPMSVNDELPWIGPVLSLIRTAVEQDIPVLGHCLGGQLMSKALGAAVTQNPVKEIGWGTVTVADHPVARDWLGDITAFDAFHWHGETFTLPPGVVRLLGSPYCANQAWVQGKHLALQCHVEMTEAMIRDWVNSGGQEIAAAAASPAVQTADVIQAEMAHKLPVLQRVAERLYTRWAAGLDDQQKNAKSSS
ncbi:MAG: GMP synthase [Sideroxydans sp.]